MIFDQRRDGLANDTELVGAGHGKFKRSGKIFGQVITSADDELALAFLRHTQGEGFFDLGMDAVAEGLGLLAHFGKVFAARGRFDAEDVLHDEQFWPEESDIAQEFLVQVTAGVFDQAGAVVGAVALAHGGEALAGGAADDDIHTGGFNKPGEFGRGEGGEVAFQSVGKEREILLEDGNRLGIEVDGGKSRQASTFQAQAESAATTKKVNIG